MKETKLDVAGAHVAIDRLEDAPEATIGLFQSLGATTFTIPGLDAYYFESREGIESAAARLLNVAEDLEGLDIDLLYHNHTQEFADVDGEYAFEVLFEETGELVKPQVDIGHAARAGTDPSALLQSLGDVRQAHVADVDVENGVTTAIGNGNIDLDAAANTFFGVGGEYLLYEHEDNDPLAALEQAATDVRNLCSE